MRQEVKKLVNDLEKVKAELKKIGHESLWVIEKSKDNQLSQLAAFNSSTEINKIAHRMHSSLEELETGLCYLVINHEDDKES